MHKMVNRLHMNLIQILANRDLTSDISTGMDIPYINATCTLNPFRAIGGGTAFPTALVAGEAIAGRGRFST